MGAEAAVACVSGEGPLPFDGFGIGSVLTSEGESKW
jgi:hypothetical protein